MTRLEKQTPGLPTAKRTLQPLRNKQSQTKLLLQFAVVQLPQRGAESCFFRLVLEREEGGWKFALCFSDQI